jgi:hypothetical protein
VSLRVENALGEIIPDEVKGAGKLFRKYLGNLLTGQRTTVKKMMSKADAAAENAVAEFLNKVGIIYLAWPQSQTKPDGDTNRAVLNEVDIRIVKVEQVVVDEEHRLIEGSAKIINL